METAEDAPLNLMGVININFVGVSCGCGHGT